MASADRDQSPRHRRQVILCADDYALTEGISEGIDQLIDAGRLSATSALVTARHWPRHARRLGPRRPRIAIGLHVDLTLGEPLGPMPHLAPSGAFPRLRTLIRNSLGGRLDEAEIAGEIARQLDRFEDALGHPPDIVDGHQHVHVLPQVRRAVLRVLAERYPGAKPMLRDPADSPAAIVARGAAVPKALGLAMMAAGFGARARACGFATNRGFSGVSPFDDGVPYARELARFLQRPGPLHLVMCHPGHPDEELARIDTLVARRRAELEALRADPDLPGRIRRPRRDESGRISWDGD
ncbi:MAG: ChbG/HpnK family deacetylase [Hyphomicrobiaceae bacterium]|nr:ChbG/HpnK family deacetylase [Hyphomicrobiaceae bacterium]